MIKIFIRYILLIAAINISYNYFLYAINYQRFYAAVLLILLIPVILYFALRDMMIRYWNYRLPFWKVMATGFVITLLSGVLLAVLYWLDDTFLHLFDRTGGISLSRRVWSYVTWYFFFALGGTPVAYLLLLFKLRSKNHKN